MKRPARLSALALVTWALVIWVNTACAAPPADASTGTRVAEIFNYDNFGAISVYRERGRVRDVVLLVSGNDGWDAAADSLAKRLADQGAVVAGIDIRHYRAQLENAAQACVTPASDFENLSHYLQSKLEFKKYLEPTLVGVAAGATLVYTTLAAAPEGLFKGALSIAFCPELDLKKALCGAETQTPAHGADIQGAEGARGVTALPAKRLPGKWIALHDEADGCSAPIVQQFVAVRGGEFVALPKAGQASIAGSMAKVEAAYARVAAPRPAVKAAPLPGSLADLPLTIVPAASSTGQWFGVFLTGDGGWVGFDKGVSMELARHNIPIVGWDSLKYFWARRTPEGAAHDLDRVLRHYSRAWNRSHVLLIGYSQGADTIPFMFNRLPEATHGLVGFTTLLGISDNAVFEFHVANWLGNPTKGIPTAPELERWSGSPYLCIYGESDGDAACAAETGHDGSVLKMTGGHHFGGGYAKIADEILSRLPNVDAARTSSR